jgi:hypothetical protein
MTNNTEVVSIVDTKPVISALDAREVNDLDIQTAFVKMVESCVLLTKKEIVDSKEIDSVFRHPVMERKYMKQVCSWIAANTPIRIKFKDNGHYESIGFAKKPKWDIANLKGTQWYAYEKASTSKAPAASVKRGMEALAREVAREAYENGNVLSVLDKARATVASDLAQMVRDVMVTDKFSDWMEARKGDLVEERRQGKGVSDEAKELAKAVA